MSKPELEDIPVPLASGSRRAAASRSEDPSTASTDQNPRSRRVFAFGVLAGLALAALALGIMVAWACAPQTRHELFHKHFKLRYDVRDYGTGIVLSTCRVELADVPGWNVDAHERWIKSAVSVK